MLFEFRIRTLQIFLKLYAYIEEFHIGDNILGKNTNLFGMEDLHFAFDTKLLTTYKVEKWECGSMCT